MEEIQFGIPPAMYNFHWKVVAYSLSIIYTTSINWCNHRICILHQANVIVHLRTSIAVSFTSTSGLCCRDEEAAFESLAFCQRKQDVGREFGFWDFQAFWSGVFQLFGLAGAPCAKLQFDFCECWIVWGSWRVKRSSTEADAVGEGS